MSCSVYGHHDHGHRDHAHGMILLLYLIFGPLNVRSCVPIAPLQCSVPSLLLLVVLASVAVPTLA